MTELLPTSLSVAFTVNTRSPPLLSVDRMFLMYVSVLNTGALSLTSVIVTLMLVTVCENLGDKQVSKQKIGPLELF